MAMDLDEWSKQRELDQIKFDDSKNVADNIIDYIGDPLQIYKFLGAVVGEYASKDDIDSFHSLDFIMQDVVAHKMTNTIMPVIDAALKYMDENNHTINNKLYLHNGFAYIIRQKLIVEKHRFRFKDVMVFGSIYSDESNYILIQDTNLIRKNIYIREIHQRQQSHSGYVRKPSIKFYKDNKFNMDYNKNAPTKPSIYGDSRDMGHVLSYEVEVSVTEDDHENNCRDNLKIIGPGKCDNALYYMMKMQHALRYFQCLDMVVNHGENYDY